MKIRPDEANLSDLLRRFNLPLPTGPQRPIGTGTATAQAIPKPAGSKGTPAAPGTTVSQAGPRPNATAGSPSTPTAPSAPSTEPKLETLLEAVGGFDVAPEPRSDVRASQRPAQPSNRSAQRAETSADQESRFVSRVSPQMVARPGLLVPTPHQGRPDPLAAPLLEARPEPRPDVAPDARTDVRAEQAAQRLEPQSGGPAQAEARATTDLPRRELLARGEPSELRTEMPNQSALSPRTPALETATMQHWAAVEVSARTLPRNVRGEISATPSDPPKKGAKRRGGGGELEWFGGRVARSNAYAVVFTLLGLLTLFVMARSCSG